MIKFFFWCIFVCLIVSTLVNITFFFGLRHYYALVVEVQLDPLGLKSYPTTAIGEKEKPRVVILGDSRASAWPVPAFLNYDYQVVNRGIGGQTSAQVMGRFGWHVAHLQPDVVLIQLGMNDLKAIGLFPERREAIVASCKDNLTELVRLSREQGAVVVLSTIFPVGKVPLARRLVWSDEISEAVVEMNAYIRSLQAEGVVVFDAYALLVGEDGLVRPAYASDFLHLNAEGYVRLNSELQSFTE